ncbi:UNVERIFIED_CONTAM: hypothetical protein GTU68_066717 [Idotea baltica]|nr:hypothetical protein [Idotea baltica]
MVSSYTQSVHGILVVYDITKKWSYDRLDQWMEKIQEHAPEVPRVLIGNRLQLAFKRKVFKCWGELYGRRHNMNLFEVCSLCKFNLTESFTELSRWALKMECSWRDSKVLSLQALCSLAIVASTAVYDIKQLDLPTAVQSQLKRYYINNYGVRLPQVNEGLAFTHLPISTLKHCQLN